MVGGIGVYGWWAYRQIFGAVMDASQNCEGYPTPGQGISLTLTP